ncbi:unnamed protein product [Ectocarpus sp. 4 AP-2014]
MKIGVVELLTPGPRLCSVGLFANVPTTTRRLDGNGLVSLPSGIFDSLMELTALSISRNDLTTLPPTIFNSLTKLNFLGISNNELLTTLPPTIFNSLTALTFL